MPGSCFAYRLVRGAVLCMLCTPPHVWARLGWARPPVCVWRIMQACCGIRTNYTHPVPLHAWCRQGQLDWAKHAVREGAHRHRPRPPAPMRHIPSGGLESGGRFAGMFDERRVGIMHFISTAHAILVTIAAPTHGLSQKPEASPNSRAAHPRHTPQPLAPSTLPSPFHFPCPGCSSLSARLQPGWNISCLAPLRLLASPPKPLPLLPPCSSLSAKAATWLR